MGVATGVIPKTHKLHKLGGRSPYPTGQGEGLKTWRIVRQARDEGGGPVLLEDPTIGGAKFRGVFLDGEPCIKAIGGSMGVLVRVGQCALVHAGEHGHSSMTRGLLLRKHPTSTTTFVVLPHFASPGFGRHPICSTCYPGASLRWSRPSPRLDHNYEI